MKIIGVLVAITCLTMGDAAQAACPTSVDAYQLQREARARDTTPEQLEIMQIAGLLVRAAAGFKSATEELVRTIFDAAALKVFQAAREKGRMATTLLASIFRHDRVTIAHVGEFARAHAGKVYVATGGEPGKEGGHRS